MELKTLLIATLFYYKTYGISNENDLTNKFVAEFCVRHELSNILYLCQNCQNYGLKNMYKNITIASKSVKKNNENETLKILQKSFKKSSTLIVIFNDTQIEIIKNIFQARNEGNKEFLLLENNRNLKLRNLQMDLDDDIFIFESLPNRKIQIKEVYKLTSVKNVRENDFTVQMDFYGFWDFYHGFSTPFVAKWDRRSDWRGLQLIVSTLPDTPFVMETVRKDGKLEFNGGTYPEVFLTLQNYFNFTYEIVEPKDGNYGTFDEDLQEWNGMINMTKNREIDASN